MKSFRKLVRILHPLRNNIKQIYLLALLQGVFYLAVPLGIQAILTYTMAGELSSSLIILCSITIVGVAFIGLLQLWQMRINETIQQSLLVNIGLRISEKISRLKPDLYLSAYLPSKINQFFDVLTLQKGLAKILLDFSFSVMSIIFGLLLLSLYSTTFLVFAIVTSIIFFFLIKRLGQAALVTSMDVSKQKYGFVNWLQNLYQSIKKNDSEVTNENILSNTNEHLLRYIQHKNEHYKIIDRQVKSILLFKIIFTAIILFLGIWLVQNGVFNVGQFVATEIVLILIINAVEKLVLNLNVVYDVLTATEKIYQIFDLEENASLKKIPNHDIKVQLNKQIYNHSYSKITKRIIYAIFIGGIIIMFLPWNQTIECNGKISTLNPTDRPQEIPSRIAGRVEKWYVKEGDFIHKNDTIAFISEVKEDYFDPKLIERTQSQLQSKESSIISYQQKINSINSQIDALNSILKLKEEQTRNKYKQAKVKAESDSIDFIATQNNYKITEEQFNRYEELLTKGLISKTDYENRKAKVQESYSKLITVENKWINSKNELINAIIEISSIEQEYNEKLMKAESEKFSVMSALYDTEANLSKMQNQLTNYNIRNSYYYVTAPQDGFVVKSFIQGVGDIVKEGTSLISFVPNSNEFSVEMYIEPRDLPLVHTEMNIQLEFDGWPAFVFSGWPGVSFGTYHANVVSIDRVISENGKFRVLAKKGKEDWPPSSQVGAGVRGLVLLNKVPVIYEFWRKINGFPPDFYQKKINNTTSEQTKK
jgi:membrane fusion protein, adhesin transport system